MLFHYTYKAIVKKKFLNGGNKQDFSPLYFK